MVLTTEQLLHDLILEGLQQLLLCDSDFDLAEKSARSPRKLFIFIMTKYYL